MEETGEATTMNPKRRKLSDLITLARRAQPTIATPENRRDFARQVVSVWKRGPVAAATPDSLQLWERAGLWSLGTATAIVLAIAMFHPAPPSAENPLNIVLNVDDDTSLF